MADGLLNCKFSCVIYNQFNYYSPGGSYISLLPINSVNNPFIGNNNKQQSQTMQ